MIAAGRCGPHLRWIYAAADGYELSRRHLTAVVAVGFGGLFSTGGIRPDGLVLQASGASRIFSRTITGWAAARHCRRGGIAQPIRADPRPALSVAGEPHSPGSGAGHSPF